MQRSVVRLGFTNRDKIGKIAGLAIMVKTTKARRIPSPHPLGRVVSEGNSPTLCLEVIQLRKYTGHGGGMLSMLPIGFLGLS